MTDIEKLMLEERQRILKLIKALEISVNALKFIGNDVRCYSLDVATIVARDALIKLQEYTSIKVIEEEWLTDGQSEDT